MQRWRSQGFFSFLDVFLQIKRIIEEQFTLVFRIFEVGIMKDLLLSR